MNSVFSNSISDTENIAKNWLKDIFVQKKDSNSAMVIDLSGNLGAGKTVFVKAVCEYLGIKETVTSPTFIIMKIYDISAVDFPWKRLVHIDAYRIEDPKEIEVLRLEKVIADPQNLILIEWPEKLGHYLDNITNHQNIKISIPDDNYQNKREFIFE
jgi:tRNA threonylcarbamoyladenosine biosynthesis protein TsaE